MQKRFIHLECSLIISAFLWSCQSTTKAPQAPTEVPNTAADSVKTLGRIVPVAPKHVNYIQSTPIIEDQISPFVRRIFEDRQGHFWFGTNGDGVIRYNGEILEYFSINEGFSGVMVRAIIEDEEGHVWFGTEGGISKFDGQKFTNYNSEDGMVHSDVWSMAFDRNGDLWIGTLEGVSIFDGHTFRDFEIPESKPDPTRGVTSARIIHSIMEDSKGWLWFGTNGGAYSYDGKQLSNLSEKDGLCNDAVNAILEDQFGHLWFATHHQGICRYDGIQFEKIAGNLGIKGSEAWSLLEDTHGYIWFPTEGYGVYRYSPTSPLHAEAFQNFHKTSGLFSNAVQCVFQDKQGRWWYGGYMGLYHYDPEKKYDVKPIVNITKQGPWPTLSKTKTP